MKKLVLVFALLLALLGCTTESRRAEMRGRLSALNALNRADSVLTATNRDEALSLVDFFDRHGTANEQMLAHYLLGRCYADMHEAPMALHCYQEAISRADTSSADCDFAQLSRVYGQSAAIFYQQGLYHNALEYGDISADYGWRGKDTLNALLSYAHKATTYNQLQLVDSAILIYESAIYQLKANRFNNVAAAFSGLIGDILIDEGETEKAEPFLLDYEQHSGYFDSVGNIVRGREIYYNVKGKYFIKTGQLDSAEYYFRKELRTGKDFNNQNCGARGLALLYQQKSKQDSAAKYFAYSYAMNDSCFVQMTTHEVEQAKAMYDYSRQQEIAQKEKSKVDRLTIRLLVVCISTILLLIVLGVIIAFLCLQQKRRKSEKVKYDQLTRQLKNAQAEIVTLHEHEAEFHRLVDERESVINRSDLQGAILKKAQTELESLREKEIQLKTLVKEKEKAIADQQAQLAFYEQRQAEIFQKGKSEQEILSDIAFYQELLGKANKGVRLSEEEWNGIDMLVKEVLPDFYKYIMMKRNFLSENEYKVCLLSRLYLPGKSSAAFIGIAPSYITKYRKDLHIKLFQGNGDSKAFVNMLRTIG